VYWVKGEAIEILHIYHSAQQPKVACRLNRTALEAQNLPMRGPGGVGDLMCAIRFSSRPPIC